MNLESFYPVNPFAAAAFSIRNPDPHWQEDHPWDSELVAALRKNGFVREEESDLVDKGEISVFSNRSERPIIKSFLQLVGVGLLGLSLNTAILHTPFGVRLTDFVSRVQWVAGDSTGTETSHTFEEKVSKLYGPDTLQRILSFNEEVRGRLGVPRIYIDDLNFRSAAAGTKTVAEALPYFDFIHVDTDEFTHRPNPEMYITAALVHEQLHLMSKQYDKDLEDGFTLPTPNLRVIGYKSGRLRVENEKGIIVDHPPARMLMEGLTHAQTLRLLPEFGFSKEEVYKFMVYTSHYTLVAQFLERIFESPTYDYDRTFAQFSAYKHGSVTSEDIAFLFGIVEQVYTMRITPHDAESLFVQRYQDLQVREEYSVGMIQ